MHTPTAIYSIRQHIQRDTRDDTFPFPCRLQKLTSFNLANYEEVETASPPLPCIPMDATPVAARSGAVDFRATADFPDLSEAPPLSQTHTEAPRQSLHRSWSNRQPITVHRWVAGAQYVEEQGSGDMRLSPQTTSPASLQPMGYDPMGYDLEREHFELARALSVSPTELSRLHELQVTRDSLPAGTHSGDELDLIALAAEEGTSVEEFLSHQAYSAPSKSKAARVRQKKLPLYSVLGRQRWASQAGDLDVYSDFSIRKKLQKSISKQYQTPKSLEKNAL